LLGVNFSQFNREALFAVIEQEKFDFFLQEIENFILKESGKLKKAKYNKKVKFIRDFKLLTTKDIINYKEFVQLMSFRLIDFPGGSKEGDIIFKHLREYLEKNGFQYRYEEEINVLEVYGAKSEKVEEIVKNFDILISVTSTLSTVVRPSKLNLVEKGYGFEIGNATEELPTIGILDTGISNNTPLAAILLNDDNYNLTKTSSFIDNANDGYGHGTSIAALAALGRKPYSVNYTGSIKADAKLLSMKILDHNSGQLSSLDVLHLLNKAKNDYPDIRLFVLTTCYSSFKSNNEDYSSYAYMLDRFAHENNSLIFICTANNNNASNQPRYNLNYFNEEETNLCSPSESMNNVIVGAAADNLKNSAFMGISTGREFPTLFTRKCHIDLSTFFPKNKQNKQLFRPDIIECGGDYEQGRWSVGANDAALMEVLSADPTRGFYRDAGTSFSTPLVANIAAQIQKAYPTLRSQTIKALILNAASFNAIVFDESVITLKNRIAGHGLVDPVKSTTSTDNVITFIIEDDIQPDKMKIFPINFPKYLTEEDLGKKLGLLSLTATLCFSFEPVLDNHLAYCPIQMAFAIFRNHSGDDILKTGNIDKGGINSTLKLSWSQNNRWKSKPIPSSNTQKIQFPISVKDLLEEQSTFKLAVHCLINSQLLSSDKYKTTHQFSLAITIEEKLPESKLTGKLYAEMIAINEIENIITLEGEMEGEVYLER
jgi:hypothetical protein